MLAYESLRSRVALYWSRLVLVSRSRESPAGLGVLPKITTAWANGAQDGQREGDADLPPPS